jgi:hypothetical protein
MIITSACVSCSWAQTGTPEYNATPTLRVGARGDADPIAAYLDAHEAWPRLCVVDHDNPAVTSPPASDGGDLDLPF